MAKLILTVKKHSPLTGSLQVLGKTSIKMGKFVPVALRPSELISNDIPNTLYVGTDGKLVATPTDVKDADFMAHYLLAKG